MWDLETREQEMTMAPAVVQLVASPSISPPIVSPQELKQELAFWIRLFGILKRIPVGIGVAILYPQLPVATRYLQDLGGASIVRTAMY